jgi:uncharacterized protein with HEPN domain
MRRDGAFVEDILEACNRIVEICEGQEGTEVEANPVERAALLHHLTVIGEAAGRLSEDLRARYPAFPWPDIISQRNRIVLSYFGLDWNLIWYSATQGVPALREWP